MDSPTSSKKTLAALPRTFLVYNPHFHMKAFPLTMQNISRVEGGTLSLKRGLDPKFKPPIKPFRFLDLPEEIRVRIYNICFVRPTGIKPTRNNYAYRLRESEKNELKINHMEYSISRYQWSGARQTLALGDMGANLPSRQGESKTIEVTWTSLPTPQELEHILSNPQLTSLPKLGARGDHQGDIERTISRRGGNHIELQNFQKISIAGLFGLGLLVTCKSIFAEAAKELYTKNNFVFNTGNCHREWSLEFFNALKNTSGQPLDQTKFVSFIDGIFEDKSGDLRAIFQNPLIRFICTIGRQNASLIRYLTLEGIFKTRSPPYNPLGFASILSVYPPLLNYVCPNLHTLTLNSSVWWDFYHGRWKFPEEDMWDTTIKWEPEKTDVERVDEVVEKLVHSLPNLKRLQIGGNIYKCIDFEDLWVKALRWTRFVEERERDRIRKENPGIWGGNTAEVWEIYVSGLEMGACPQQPGAESSSEAAPISNDLADFHTGYGDGL